jgi:hypothetical protein
MSTTECSSDRCTLALSLLKTWVGCTRATQISNNLMCTPQFLFQFLISPGNLLTRRLQFSKLSVGFLTSGISKGGECLVRFHFASTTLVFLYNDLLQVFPHKPRQVFILRKLAVTTAHSAAS